MKTMRIFAIAMTAVIVFGLSITAHGVTFICEDYTARKADVKGAALFTNEQLKALAAKAPSYHETRSAAMLPERWLTESELDAWKAEYIELGSANAFELEVIRLINIERLRLGLRPLAIDTRLMMAARFKSQELVDIGGGRDAYGNFNRHYSPVYGYVFVIPVELFGVERLFGENLGLGHRSPERLVYAWMSSPGHRAHMLSETAVRAGAGRAGAASTLMTGH